MTDRNLSVIEAVRGHASHDPARTAIHFDGGYLSYGELWHKALLAGRWYTDNGIQPGDRILLPADGTDRLFAPAYLGIHLARAVGVPMPPRSAENEIAERRDRLGAVMCLTGELKTSLADRLNDDGAAPEETLADWVPEPDDIADILFTTGSTGAPKAVTLTHANLAYSANAIASVVGNTPDDVEVSVLPVCHSFGLGRLRSVLTVGGSIAFVPGLVFPQVVIEKIKALQATGLSTVPAGMRLLLSRCSAGIDEVGPQIRYMKLGSAPFSAEEKAALCKTFPNAHICMHYGLTEASRSTFLDFEHNPDKLDSVGTPSPGAEIGIFDKKGQPCAAGTIGRIHVRGPNVMAGYWGDRGRTDEVLSSAGWLYTGDLGHLDEDGFLYLAGRADDVINSGGYTILPDDVERIARDFGGLDDVACKGIADPEGVLGEVPCLFVVSGGDICAADLITFVKSRLGSPVSKLIVEPVSDIPRAESGKLLRHKLPEQVHC